jgi:plasmid stabilization system protein ParE
MNVEFHPAARLAVENAQAWYEERSLIAASAFLRELSIAVQRIQQTPQRYPTAEAGTQRIVFDSFPFDLLPSKVRQR